MKRILIIFLGIILFSFTACVKDNSQISNTFYQTESIASNSLATAVSSFSMTVTAVSDPSGLGITVTCTTLPKVSTALYTISVSGPGDGYFGAYSISSPSAYIQTVPKSTYFINATCSTDLNNSPVSVSGSAYITTSQSTNKVDSITSINKDPSIYINLIFPTTSTIPNIESYQPYILYDFSSTATAGSVRARYRLANQGNIAWTYGPIIALPEGLISDAHFLIENLPSSAMYEFQIGASNGAGVPPNDAQYQPSVFVNPVYYVP